MKVKVKLYSLFRDLTGSSVLEIDLEKDSYEELLEKLSRVEGIAKAMKVLEGSYVILDGNGKRLERGELIESDVIHLMPLPSGGSLKTSVKVLKESDDIDLNELVNELSELEVGAIALFIGVVKPKSEGERVQELLYEHSPELLEKTLEKIAKEVGEKWELKGIAIAHYVGRRKPGEKTIVIATAGLSRKNAIPALAEALERVKHEAPIFKIEVRETEKVYIVGDKTVRVNLNSR
ncbi:MAG: molybdenum cofactor biosynthesis protein MoaE [Acidilobaceae archaeon]